MAMNKIALAGIGLVVYLLAERSGSINEKPCPEPTQDETLNAKNRQSTKDNFLYGPMNEDPNEYWPKIAAKWNVSVEKAKTRRCGNCVAYDQSPRMRKCMGTKNAKIGYCWMHHFKCGAHRTCSTWAEGGPIKTDTKSYEWQK